MIMGAGGIIQQRAAALLLSITESSWYDSLSADSKAIVDGVDGKDPMTRTQEDVNALLKVLNEANGC
jgi:hypothetical protein